PKGRLPLPGNFSASRKTTDWSRTLLWIAAIILKRSLRSSRSFSYPVVSGKQSGKEKTAGPTPCRFVRIQILHYFLLTAFLSSAPGVNFATLRAAILIVAPVCGLRPFRAFLCETEKVP